MEYDSIVDDTMQAGVDTEQTEDAAGTGSEVQAEAISRLADALPDNLMPPEMKEELASLDMNEIMEYSVMIQKVLTNPDFQSLLQYDEVQRLLSTLMDNALNFAKNDPALTKKILETLGVDEKLVLVFYGVLEAIRSGAVTEDIDRLLQSEEGQALVEIIVQNVKPEQIEMLVDTLNHYIATVETAQAGQAAETEAG